MSDARMRTPWHLRLVGVVAPLFNAIGVFDFVKSGVQGESDMASAGMTEAQIAHYRDMPAWMILVWAIGAFGASIPLLARRKAAFAVFLVSLVAFPVSLLYTYVLTGGGAVMGTDIAVTSAVIASLLLFFSRYAGLMIARGVLR